MDSRTRFFAVLVSVAGAMAITASNLLAFTQTTGTLIRVTQVKPLTEKGAKNDPKIAPDALRYLKSKFGSKYDAFGLEAQDAREAKLGHSEDFPMVTKDVVTFRVTGYEPATGVIHLSVKKDDDVRLITIQSGNHLYFVYPADDKDQPPLIVVVLVKLLQVQR